MISDTHLDHVAVAVERHSDAWPRYLGDLSGRWRSGGVGAGFAPAQVGYANRAKVEVLRPYAVEQNDFLRRFLDRNGPGAHHLTFKVGDIDEALSESAAAGYTPINVDLRDPTWKEAFIHPKGGTGVLIQLAEAGGGWLSPAPAGLPAPRTPEPAALAHIAHAVASLDEGLRLFADLLGGREDGRGACDSHRWVDLNWEGGGSVRLVAPSSEGSPLWSWLGARAGRVLYLGFACNDPDQVPGTSPLTKDAWSVAPADNLGVGLVLVPPGSSAFAECPLPSQR